MAKLLFTAVVADMRNKLNGTVFSKNRYGAYARTKVTPVNPQTTAQQAARNRLATNSQAWRGLTEIQRDSWTGAAPQFPMRDIFGNSKILSGSALYVKLNNNLNVIGLPPIATSPSPTEIPALVLTSLSSTAAVPSLSMVFGDSPVPADFEMVVEATPPVGAGISFVKNKYRIVSTQAAATATPVNLLSDYSAIFGNPVAGQKIFVRAKLVSTITGQAGIPSSAYAIVAA